VQALTVWQDGQTVKISSREVWIRLHRDLEFGRDELLRQRIQCHILADAEDETEQRHPAVMHDFFIPINPPS
jgi:hypothetical protein